MSFEKWLRKLDSHAHNELARDLIEQLSDEDLLEFCEDVIDLIHDRGIDIEGYHN